jgi:hypothetical protein
LPALKGSGQGDAAGLGELDGVGEQVEQYLTQPQRIADAAGRQVGGFLQAQVEALGAGTVGDEFEGAVEHVAKRHFAGFDVQLAGVDLGEVEDFIDYAEQLVAGGEDLLEGVAGLFGVLVIALADLGETEHAVHRRTDLVAHVGEEFAPRPRQALGGRQRIFPGLGGGALGADVDDADHRADDFPVFDDGMAGQCHRYRMPVGVPVGLVIDP